MTSRRSLLRQIATLSSVAGLAPALLPGLIREALANGNKPIAPGIIKITGNVTINGQAASVGMMINDGDTINTGPAAEAIYVINQDAYLQRGNSSVQIGKDVTRQWLRIISGRLLAVFAKGEKRIETRTATIGIRGTGCDIEAEAERMYICLCYGEADFVPNVAPEKAQRLTTRHHESPVWISASNARQPITPAPMINHTDAELVLLEELVGRRPPFSGKAY